MIDTKVEADTISDRGTKTGCVPSRCVSDDGLCPSLPGAPPDPAISSSQWTAGAEGIQAQFLITGQETALEAASIDVAVGKDEEIVSRLRKKILPGSMKDRLFSSEPAKCETVEQMWLVNAECALPILLSKKENT